MHSLLLVIHVILAATLILLVLIQHGKGADAGAAFGSGASATVFGARGSASFLTRATGVLAALFFITSLTLAYLTGQTAPVKSVTDAVPASAPASPKPPVKAGSNSDVPNIPGTDKPSPPVPVVVPAAPPVKPPLPAK